MINILPWLTYKDNKIYKLKYILNKYNINSYEHSQEKVEKKY